MAPAVDAAALPGLDAKVDTFLTSLMPGRPRSPEFAAKATDVRSMGDDDIRAAAETLEPAAQVAGPGAPGGRAVRGLQGRLARCSSCAVRSRTWTRRRRPGSKKLLGMIPFGDKLEDYFRKYQCAQSHLDAILHALRNGQDELGQGQRRAEPGEAAALGRDDPAEPVRVRRRAAGRPAVGGDRGAGGDRPGEGEGAARGRAVLRPAEAPGPAHPARRVDPELPGHRHRDQEQHRADQGCRPRLDHDRLGAADRGDRGPGARQPEAGAGPDQRAQHHDQPG